MTQMMRTSIMVAAAVLMLGLHVAIAGQPAADAQGQRIQTLFNQGLQAVRNGRADDAIEKLQQVVKLAPTAPYPAYLLAKAFAMKKDQQSARQWFSLAAGRGLMFSHELLMEVETDPNMGPIRSWPKYAQLVRSKADFGMAPDLAATDLDGNKVKLSDLKGKPILLVFWSVRCGPCHMELKALQKPYEQLADKGLVVLALAPESAADQKRDIKKSGWKFTFWRYDLGEKMLPLLYALTAQQTPANFFIHRDGRIARFYPGYVRAGDFSYAIDLITKDGSNKDD